MSKIYAVKLHAGMPTMKIIEKQKGDEVLQFCYREIGCDLIDIAPTKYLPEPYIMIVDDEGLLKADPDVNFLGSYLYGIQDHGMPIMGNALIMKEQGQNIVWLSEEECQNVLSYLDDIFMDALQAVLKKAR